MGMGVVASFLDPTEAEIAAGALRSAGFQAVAMDRNFSTMDWMAMQSLGGIRVAVPDSEVEEAAALLGQLIRDQPEPDVLLKRGPAWHIFAIAIGLVIVLSWAVIRPEALWQKLLLAAGACAVPLGWIVVGVVKGRRRSGQMTGVMLVVAGLLVLTAAFIGVGLLFTWLPGVIHPNGRS